MRPAGILVDALTVSKHAWIAMKVMALCGIFNVKCCTRKYNIVSVNVCENYCVIEITATLGRLDRKKGAT